MTRDIQPAPAPEELLKLLRDPLAASRVPFEAIPALRGELARLDTLLLSRLLSNGQSHVDPPDKYLSIPEAAARLSVSPGYLYHHRNLPFLRREGRRLLASRSALDDYMRRKQ
jgi:excisionase family DNA binding protein